MRRTKVLGQFLSTISAAGDDCCADYFKSDN